MDIERSQGKLAETGSTTVRTVSIDDLVEGGFPAPDVVKMDIEGGEVSALAGMARVIRRHRPTIFLATHGAEVHRHCLALLASSDYSVRELGSPDELLATPTAGG